MKESLDQPEPPASVTPVEREPIIEVAQEEVKQEESKEEEFKQEEEAVQVASSSQLEEPSTNTTVTE